MLPLRAAAARVLVAAEEAVRVRFAAAGFDADVAEETLAVSVFRFDPRFDAALTDSLSCAPFGCGFAFACARLCFCASSRFVSSWCACESKKRPLAAWLVAFWAFWKLLLSSVGEYCIINSSTLISYRCGELLMFAYELTLICEGATDVAGCPAEAWEETPFELPFVIEWPFCCWLAVCWLSTPVIALSVLGVIVDAEFPFALWLTIARNAAVFGEGGGKATGPPTSGVSPVDGVSPVRKVPEGSKPKIGGWMPALDARAAMEEAG